MNSIDSIEKSVQILEKKSVPYALLHCTNVYQPPELVRLGAIQERWSTFQMPLLDCLIIHYLILHVWEPFL